MMNKTFLRCTLLLAALPVALLRIVPAHAESPPALPRVLDRPAQQTARAPRMAMLAIARAGARLVAVGEAGVVLLSDDDGKRWHQAQVPVSVSLTAVQFIDARLGYATGHMGVVLVTRDGGEHWNRLLDGEQAARLVLAQEEARRAAARDASETAAADKALKDARQLVADGPDKPFLGLYFRNADEGYIFGAYNLIFHTRDGGKSWVPWQDRVPNPMGFHLYGMAEAGGELFLAGEQGLLLHSHDGGEHFEPLASPYKGSFFGITAAGNTLIAFGLRGNAFRSTDLGATWSKLDTHVSVAISACHALPDGRLALVSQSGAVLVSQDGGQTFQAVPKLPPLPLADLAQAPDGQFVVASLAGAERLDAVATP